MAIKKAIYLGGGGVPYTVITGSTPQEIQQKSVDKGINPTNLYGENLGFGHNIDELKAIGNEQALKEFGIQTWTNTSTQQPKQSQPVTSEQKPLSQSPAYTGLTSFRYTEQGKQAAATQTGVEKNIQKKLNQTSANFQYTEGGYYKAPDSSTVYQYMAGKFRPIESEEVYRAQTGTQEGQPTDWSKVKNIDSVPKEQVGETVTAKGTKMEGAQTPLKDKELTPEWMAQEYKTYLGQDYEPSVDEEGNEQTWESITRHHAIKGTSKEELIDWLRSPITQARVESEKREKERGMTDIYTDSEGSEWYKDEDGAIRRLDDETRKKLEAEGKLTGNKKTLTVNEENTLKTIQDLGAKTDTEIRVSDLVNAGFNPEQSAQIIASFRDDMPKWSETVDKIESEYSDKMKQVEADITEAENKIVAQLEKNSNLVNTFNSYYTSAGLDEIKNKISEIDSQIDQRIKQRDNEMLDIRGQVIPQWMITGDKELAIQRYTNQIEQLRNERNNLADEYNRNWDEVLLKAGLAEKDTVNDAENLAGLLELYEGRKDRYNEKLAEALEKGGIEHTEERDEIINEIMAGMAPTLSSMAQQAAQAKLTGEPITWGNSDTGLYQYDPNTDTWTQITSPVADTLSMNEQEKAKSQLVWEWISSEPTTEDESEDGSRKLTDEEIAKEIMNAGLDPADFGYGIEEIKERTEEQEKERRINWETTWDEYKYKKWWQGDNTMSTVIKRETSYHEGENLVTVKFIAKKDLTRDQIEKLYSKGMIDKGDVDIEKGEVVYSYITQKK